MTDTTTAPEAPPDGYPGGTYAQPRRMGQFNWLKTAGFVVHPEDQVITRKYFGLRHTDTWFDAFVTGSSGNFYLFSHDVQSDADGALAAAGIIGGFRTTPSGLEPDERYGQWSGTVTQTLTPDNRIVYAATGPTSAEEVSFGETAFEWKSENGDIQLAGALSGQGTQWHHAWRRPDDDTGEMFYNQQGYSVEGTYFGESVSGHVMVETMWGNENYPNTWFVQNRIGHWASFMNDYDDGTSEFGQILFGEYGARGAVIVDNTGREIVCTTNLNAFEEADGQVRYEFGNGETWQFWVDPRIALSFPRTQLGFGGCKRVDEQRTIVKASGSYLTADHLPPPQPFS
jgi:hypothetical protein